MTIDEISKRLLHKEFEIKELKVYLLNAIYEIKKAYKFIEEQYRCSETLAIYQNLLNKVNQLEVMEI